MIRSLHFIYDLSTAGSQTVVMNYLRYLKDDEDLEIIVAVTHKAKNTAYEIEAKKNGYKVFFCNYSPSKAIPIIRTIINWFRYQKAVYDMIRNVHPDVLHSHGTDLLPFSSFPFFFSGIKPRFHTLHSDPYALSKRFVIWAKIAFRFLGINPICVTESQAEKAKKRYGIKKCSIIHNGIDERRFVASNSRNDIRNALGITENITVVGCVGRLDKIKNHKFLLNVFGEFLKDNPHSILLLIGDGPEKAALLEQAKALNIEKKVIFAGQKTDIERYYFSMDIFMLTSFYESSSIVTAEAQFAGLKCVIADSIPKNVVISNRVNRISLKAPIKTWVAAMKDELPHDPQIGNLEKFSMQRTVKELKSIYGKL